MKFVVIKPDIAGIDISQGRIMDDWQHALVATGCYGRVPLDLRSTTTAETVIVVNYCDTGILRNPAGDTIQPESIVFQTDSDEEWEAWAKTSLMPVGEI